MLATGRHGSKTTISGFTRRPDYEGRRLESLTLSLGLWR
jgi:hypothetical protein